MKLLGSVCVALMACSEPPRPEPDPFIFTTHIPLYADVTDVLVDGSPQDLDPRGIGAHELLFDEQFETYEAAKLGPPITIEVFVGEMLRNTGQTMAGFCARDCAGFGCPPSKDMRHEIVLLGQRDFDVSDFDMVTCVGTEWTTGFGP